MSDLIDRQAAIDALENDKASLDHIIRGMSANDVRLDAYVSQRNQVNYDIDTINNLPTAQLGTNLAEVGADCISRRAAIEVLRNRWLKTRNYEGIGEDIAEECEIYLKTLPPAQPDGNKYEYHYDHTDCIWHRPEARNRCPATCAQYRDGWNDAMNYIFRDGKGYRPYRRNEQYEQ